MVEDFGLQVLLARALGSENLGAYSLVLAWLGVLLLFATFGIDSIFVRFVPKYEMSNQGGILGALVYWGFKNAAKYALLISLLIFLLVGILWGITSHLVLKTFIAGAVLLPIFTSLWIRQALFRSLKQIIAARLPDVVFKPLFFAALLFIYWWFQEFQMVSSPRAMLLHCVAAVTSLLLAIRLFRYDVPPHDETIDLKPHVAEWRASALPLLGVSVMIALANEVDKIALGFFCPMSEVGQYSVAFRLSLFVSFGSDSILAMGVPLLSGALASRSTEGFQKITSKVSLWLLTVTLPLFIGVSLFGGEVLRLFGRDFGNSYSLLVILAAGQFAYSLNGVAGSILVISNKPETLFRAALILLVGSVVLSSFAAYVGGSVAVAVVAATMLAVRGFLFSRIAKGLLSVETGGLFTLRYFFNLRKNRIP